jgi:hypothetical protein
MIIVCMFLMAICLAAEGVVLLLSGFPLPGQSPMLYAVGTLWVSTSLSMFKFLRHPLATTAFGCLLFAVNACDLWFHSSEEKSVPWFLYQHSLEIVFIGLSCIGFALLRRQKTASSASHMY